MRRRLELGGSSQKDEPTGNSKNQGGELYIMSTDLVCDIKTINLTGCVCIMI